MAEMEEDAKRSLSGLWRSVETVSTIVEIRRLALPEDNQIEQKRSFDGIVKVIRSLYFFGQEQHLVHRE
jgi:hypothetical protein